MRRPPTAAFLCTVAVLLTACQTPPPQPAGLSEADLAAVAETRQAYMEGSLAGDWARVAALHTENSVRMPPNAPAVTGRDAIEADLAGFGTLTEFTITPEETTGAGDMAHERGSYTLAFTPPGMAEPVNDTGKYLVTLARQPDGRWLLVNEIWNSDLPLPQGGAPPDPMD